MNFPNLKWLSLESNEISDINVLDKFKFNKLEDSNLNNNKISDIKVLENVKLLGLKKLRLLGNNIANLNVFKKVKYLKLDNLYINIDIKKKRNKKILDYLKSYITKDIITYDY